jgi:hypothetical protein
MIHDRYLAEKKRTIMYDMHSLILGNMMQHSSVDMVVFINQMHKDWLKENEGKNEVVAVTEIVLGGSIVRTIHFKHLEPKKIEIVE